MVKQSKKVINKCKSDVKLIQKDELWKKIIKSNLEKMNGVVDILKEQYLQLLNVVEEQQTKINELNSKLSQTNIAEQESQLDEEEEQNQEEEEEEEAEEENKSENSNSELNSNKFQSETSTDTDEQKKKNTISQKNKPVYIYFK